MKRRHFVLSAVALPAVFAARAHHGWSSFDENKPIYLAGRVKSVKWQNPHAEAMLTPSKDLKLPGDLAKRSAPAQQASVDGAKILANAQLPKKRNVDWNLEFAPMFRMEAWKVAELKAGDDIAVVGYTYVDEKGAATMRVEYLIVGEKMYGLRSMPV